MNEILSMLYLWLKSAHLIFVIFWMAGLFMMPRFFVYHQESPVGSDEDAKWIEREGKLRKIILNPSLVIVWVVGLALAYDIGAFSQGWFHAKLLMVLALSGYHGWMIAYSKKLSRGERTMTDRKLRLVNEVPGIAAAVIVILVIIKPF
ncbi:CopD family protein [Parasphingorhabdus flavimaris]|jgi:protoporphyrinogen IX oxidase|uniref:Protoporphyrinogen IX oxidase n=1 Tax=Parasphingorhabdus flavimaris TaxID=266812 RepID=A0ABX2N5P3_9SPHN|nr:CopD family protein [Parasphingorhabdus flavimaris]NVD28918.1 CopD family protein [Parasphingorhabdus flavimaris]|tara:strand:- start:3171 stop:3614 length:444 start_codon:yes stop_codon:yes gene_type:complete